MSTRRRLYAAALTASLVCGGASTAFASPTDDDTKKVCVTLGSDSSGKAPVCVWIPISGDQE